jgi:hypothetical protein
VTQHREYVGKPRAPKFELMGRKEETNKHEFDRYQVNENKKTHTKKREMKMKNEEDENSHTAKATSKT